MKHTLLDRLLLNFVVVVAHVATAAVAPVVAPIVAPVSGCYCEL